jgi:microcompartment protein CcmL/EutN
MAKVMEALGMVETKVSWRDRQRCEAEGGQRTARGLGKVGSGLVTVFVGDVAAVKAAVDAGRATQQDRRGRQRAGHSPSA